MQTKIKVDKKNLPLNEEKRMDLIFNHFSDHEIEITETSSHYHLELKRSSFLYCENRIDKLKLFGIEEKDVIDFFIMNNNSIFCLLESWIPYGWSVFFNQQKTIFEALTIIHLDDHADLMPPKISIHKGEWKDMLTNEVVKFSDPKSIKKAIKSGAITLGSIMTILVHCVQNINILHLKQNSKPLVRYIKKSFQMDKLITPNQRRLSVDLTNFPKGNEQKNKYLKTSSIDDIIQSIPAKTDIFLHIDMDFFNNRFNGSNDYKKEGHHNPYLKTQKKLMNKFFNALSDTPNVINRIKHVSIGLSPSFYPAEYWEEGLKCLLKKLDSINLKTVNFSKCLSKLRK